MKKRGLWGVFLLAVLLVFMSISVEAASEWYCLEPSSDNYCKTLSVSSEAQAKSMCGGDQVSYLDSLPVNCQYCMVTSDICEDSNDIEYEIDTENIVEEQCRWDFCEEPVCCITTQTSQSDTHLYYCKEMSTDTYSSRTCSELLELYPEELERLRESLGEANIEDPTTGEETPQTTCNGNIVVGDCNSAGERCRKYAEEFQLIPDSTCESTDDFQPEICHDGIDNDGDDFIDCDDPSCKFYESTCKIPDSGDNCFNPNEIGSEPFCCANVVTCPDGTKQCGGVCEEQCTESDQVAPSNLRVLDVAGKAEFAISWRHSGDGCHDDGLDVFNILQCRSNDNTQCTPLEPIQTLDQIGATSYSYTKALSEDFAGKKFCYRIQAVYENGVFKDSEIKCQDLGHSECISREYVSGKNFCLAESVNKRFSCLENNDLEPKDCSEGEKCYFTSTSEGAVCADVLCENCNDKLNAFGFDDEERSYTYVNDVKKDCAAPDFNFCYYDYDKANINAYDNCADFNHKLGCYAYATEAACNAKKCTPDNGCEWKEIDPEFGIGVCADTEPANQLCGLCNKYTELDDSLINSFAEHFSYPLFTCTTSNLKKFGENCEAGADENRNGIIDPSENVYVPSEVIDEYPPVTVLSVPEKVSKLKKEHFTISAYDAVENGVQCLEKQPSCSGVKYTYLLFERQGEGNSYSNQVRFAEKNFETNEQFDELIDSISDGVYKITYYSVDFVGKEEVKRTEEIAIGTDPADNLDIISITSKVQPSADSENEDGLVQSDVFVEVTLSRPATCVDYLKRNVERVGGDGSAAAKAADNEVFGSKFSGLTDGTYSYVIECENEDDNKISRNHDITINADGRIAQRSPIEVTSDNQTNLFIGTTEPTEYCKFISEDFARTNLTGVAHTITGPDARNRFFSDGDQYYFHELPVLLKESGDYFFEVVCEFKSGSKPTGVTSISFSLDSEAPVTRVFGPSREEYDFDEWKMDHSGMRFACVDYPLDEDNFETGFQCNKTVFCISDTNCNPYEKEDDKFGIWRNITLEDYDRKSYGGSAVMGYSITVPRTICYSSVENERNLTNIDLYQTYKKEAPIQGGKRTDVVCEKIKGDDIIPEFVLDDYKNNTAEALPAYINESKVRKYNFAVKGHLYDFTYDTFSDRESVDFNETSIYVADSINPTYVYISKPQWDPLFTKEGFYLKDSEIRYDFTLLEQDSRPEQVHFIFGALDENNYYSASLRFDTDKLNAQILLRKVVDGEANILEESDYFQLDEDDFTSSKIDYLAEVIIDDGDEIDFTLWKGDEKIEKIDTKESFSGGYLGIEVTGQGGLEVNRIWALEEAPEDIEIKYVMKRADEDTNVTHTLTTEAEKDDFSFTAPIDIRYLSEETQIYELLMHGYDKAGNLAIGSYYFKFDPTIPGIGDLNITDPIEVHHCMNKVWDASLGELDEDCGGPCGPCKVNQNCTSDADCSSGLYCGDNNKCLAASCNDGFKNGQETDRDCGRVCAFLDKLCQIDQQCIYDDDCESNFCNQGFCDTARCDDGIMNGNEEGRDCGGDCAPCPEETKTNNDKKTDKTDDEKKSRAWIWLVLIIVLILAAGGGAGYYYYTELYFPYRKKGKRFPEYNFGSIVDKVLNRDEEFYRKLRPTNPGPMGSMNPNMGRPMGHPGQGMSRGAAIPGLRPAGQGNDRFSNFGKKQDEKLKKRESLFDAFEKKDDSKKEADAKDKKDAEAKKTEGGDEWVELKADKPKSVFDSLSQITDTHKAKTLAKGKEIPDNPFDRLKEITGKKDDSSELEKSVNAELDNDEVKRNLAKLELSKSESSDPLSKLKEITKEKEAEDKSNDDIFRKLRDATIAGDNKSSSATAGKKTTAQKKTKKVAKKKSAGSVASKSKATKPQEKSPSVKKTVKKTTKTTKKSTKKTTKTTSKTTAKKK